MKTIIKTIFILLANLTFYGSIAQTQTPNGSTSNPDDKWDLLPAFSDEFNDSNIDWSKWSKRQNLPNTKAWKWNNDANVNLVTFKAENAAEITIRHNTNNVAVNNTYFNSGCLQTIQQLPKNFVGYVEAKIHGADINAGRAEELDKRRGVCPAFWLYSEFFDNKPIGETVYSEIDVVELQQLDYDVNAPAGVEKQDFIDDAESNLHLVKKASFGRDWFRPKQPKARDNQLNKYHLGFDPAKDWHTYGCEITPTKLYFYVDGVFVGKALNNTNWSDNPMYVIASLGLRVPFVGFQNNVFTAINPETNSRAQKNLSEIPTSMYVDYIRVWERNDGEGGDTGTDPDPSPDTDTDRGNENINANYNPSKKSIVINAPFKSRIVMINLANGQTVKSGKTNRSDKLTLRVSDLSAGLYSIRVTNKGEITDLKLAIN